MEDERNGVEMRELRRRYNGEEEKEAEEWEEASIERVFDGERIPPWREQLTLRALVASFVISVMFSVVSMRLMLTVGITPSLNPAAGLLGYFFIKTWTKALEKTGLLRTPFTRQENTVIQTCVVAAYGIAYSGGFGTYIFAMSSKVASPTEPNYSQNIKEPKLGWIIGFLFAVSFLGLFSIIPLRSIMLVDYKLIFPSATATGHLINGFHTPQGAKLAEKQVKKLGQFFVYSFLWSLFQWFYSGGEDCGFSYFPTLGLKAFQNNFYFNFSPTYVGVGMICPYIVNASVLLGGILSWGIMWPLIRNQKGHWYPADLQKDDIQGFNGYKVFIAIAMILGDGLYNFIKVLSRTIISLVPASKGSASTLPLTGNDQWATGPLVSYDDQRRTDVFLKDQIPKSVALWGYAIVAAVSVATVPRIFPSLIWYHILLAYIFAPILAFCNTYGCGLTDWSLASTYGKLAIFIFGSWAGSSHGGVLAGLAACGVMMSITSTATDLMQDFKTGYLTLASSRSLFISQAIGTAMGCVISPSVFWLFYKAFKDIGKEGSEYPALFGIIYRNIAIVGVNGFSSLPKHCLTLCYIFFAFAMLINLARDLSPHKVSRFLPIPMAMAISFYFGPYIAIDMFVGSCILFVWETINKASANKFGSAVASGMICGEGMWALPQSMLSLAKVHPPICMKFLSWSTSARVDKLLST